MISRKKGRSDKLRIYLFGPGVGESIVINLPCGGWGVVDCYQPSSRGSDGTLNFLKKRKVKQLAFFCVTHPHEDHYRGAHLLLEYYTGKIDRIWRHPGFTKKDILAKVLTTTSLKSARKSDPEAARFVDDYKKMLNGIDKEKARLDEYTYRRISGPLLLAQHEKYQVHALAPSGHVIDRIEEHIGKLDLVSGHLLLDDQEGEFLNALSVVLHIVFGDQHIFLLGDAQGETEHLHPNIRECKVLKVAHHGSENGLAAKLITIQKEYSVSEALITPYNRSNLPRTEMVRLYKSICDNFHLPKPRAKKRNLPIPGMPSGRSVENIGGWIGLEITKNGKVQRCSPA